MSINFKSSLFLGVFFFSFLYCLLYILRDFYFATESFQIRKCINKVLPFFTKYNSYFLITTFVFLILNSYNIYITGTFLYIIISLIILSFLFIYIPIKKIASTKYLKILSYVLLIMVFLIPIL